MRNNALVHRFQAKTRVVCESPKQEKSLKAPQWSNLRTRVSLLRSRVVTISTLTIVACMIAHLENFSRDNPPPDPQQRPVMLQMHGNSVIQLALQANPTRFIQDRRNHYWQDNGVTWHEFGRESFALEEGCEILGDWQEKHNPSCNEIHEIDMTEFFHRDTVLTTDNVLVQSTNYLRSRQTLDYITTGGFRSVWKVSEYDGTKRALKTLRYSKERSFDERTFERHRVDAVAMEQLTASPYVADIYGYCANSALVDYSNHADLNSIFRRGNQPTKHERFKIALDAASAVADMHHFNSDGRATMAHKDIKPEQWILIDGRYKLNDFNLCRFLTWNPEQKQYCGYSYGYSGGEWQAPEQFLESAPLTHKADVYSLGNVLYFLLTESRPFFHMSYSEAEKKIRKGKRPEIPALILNSMHPFDVSLRKAIDMCMVFDPEKRPDARSVAAFLQKALADYNRSAIS